MTVTQTHMPSSSMTGILQLPPDIRLEYLAEGGANVAYRIESASQPQLGKYLLRLHKTVPWIPSYALLYSTQAQLVNPLFAPSQLVTQILVAVPSHVICLCNAELKAGEAGDGDSIQQSQAPPTIFRRPRKRHGLYLAEEEPYGLLVTDMTADPAQDELALEFKPKWLIQSPNAAAGSTRCRTCALRAMRLHDQAALLPQTSRRRSKSSLHFCTLDLLSSDRTTLSTVVAVILATQTHPHPLPPAQHAHLTKALTDFLLTSPLLPHLRSLQASLDPGGILSLPVDATPSENFLIATTLRDCTLFFKLRLRRTRGTGKQAEEEDGEEEVEARLGDLDVKAPEGGKVTQWRETERRLVDEGWYLGRDDDGGGCRLQRVANAGRT